MKNNTITRGALALALSLFVAGGAVACKSGPEDASLTATVKGKLAADTTTKARTINVDTKDGVVTLSGNVESEAEKTQAATLAKGTEGVKSVTNNLQVKPAVAATAPTTAPTTTPAATGNTANDAAIKNSIQANLTKAGVTGVTVTVTGGVATLTGTVSAANYTKAVQAANEASPKASSVQNQLAKS